MTSCWGGRRRNIAKLLAAFEVFRVGVFAPLDILEARERQRGDRLIGLARWQFDRVHKDMKYDLEVDTSSASPMRMRRYDQIEISALGHDVGPMVVEISPLQRQAARPRKSPLPGGGGSGLI